ncbi:hypothetical protein CCACVL1_01455 [Corchorus capsularis]|uniref:Uncharacterized protein n=1 Tax=Corchorus capsularis TaxID=210143 RepID=A0A1R3KHZ8_COCAP|nr:hypothetical protein CCACVL1_01455 [Corchorus capsularis]
MAYFNDTSKDYNNISNLNLN